MEQLFIVRVFFDGAQLDQLQHLVSGQRCADEFSGMGRGRDENCRLPVLISLVSRNLNDVDAAALHALACGRDLNQFRKVQL